MKRHTSVPSPAVHNGVTVNHTLDPGFARSMLSDNYKSHKIRPLSSVNGFAFVHMSAAVPVGSFNILRYGSAVEITPEPFNDFFMLEMPIFAGVDIESSGRPSVRSDTYTALFLPPHVRFASSWRDGCVQLMLKVENAEVLRRWQAITGDEATRLPSIYPEIDLRTPEGWRVQQIMFLLRHEFEHAVNSKTGTLSRSPLAGAAIDAVIAYYRERHGSQHIEGRHRVLPAQLRHCVGYILQNLAKDLSIPILVRQTQISERSLFNLFQTFLDTTPKGYVLEQRLRKSRKLLLRGQFTVSEAARMAGFSHLGRFSGEYRKRYGENPSRTGN